MSGKAEFATPQESFWAGKFGSEYILRNRSEELLASNLQFFSRCLRRAGRIRSCVELGANIGMNLSALKLLYPGISVRGIEINREAAAELAELIGAENTEVISILDWHPTEPADLALVRGVLIHTEPEMLSIVYERLYQAAKQFVLIAEYYNPTPIAVTYRGYEDRLFKRDFAGEMLDLYPGLKLRDYGFSYRRDPSFPQDDITWFLLEKRPL
jgi:spore coat polysaccharide biosynthesis protein SpsF